MFFCGLKSKTNVYVDGNVIISETYIRNVFEHSYVLDDKLNFVADRLKWTTGFFTLCVNGRLYKRVRNFTRKEKKNIIRNRPVIPARAKTDRNKRGAVAIRQALETSRNRLEIPR